MKRKELINNIGSDLILLFLQVFAFWALFLFNSSIKTFFLIVSFTFVISIIKWILLRFDDNKKISKICDILAVLSLFGIGFIYVIRLLLSSILYTIMFSMYLIILLAGFFWGICLLISNYWCPLTSDTITYFVLTFTTITYANFGERPIKFFTKIWDVEERKKMVIKPYDKKTIKWLFAFIYFVAFVISSFMSLNCRDSYLSNVIIKAFATWIVFDRFFDNDITRGLSLKLPLSYIIKEWIEEKKRNNSN